MPAVDRHCVRRSGFRSARFAFSRGRCAPGQVETSGLPGFRRRRCAVPGMYARHVLFWRDLLFCPLFYHVRTAVVFLGFVGKLYPSPHIRHSLGHIGIFCCLRHWSYIRCLEQRTYYLFCFRIHCSTHTLPTFRTSSHPSRGLLLGLESKLVCDRRLGRCVVWCSPLGALMQ